MLNTQTDYNNDSSAIPTSVIRSNKKQGESIYILGEIEKPEHALNKTYIENLLNLKWHYPDNLRSIWILP